MPKRNLIALIVFECWPDQIGPPQGVPDKAAWFTFHYISARNTVVVIDELGVRRRLFSYQTN
ncbi:Uncharacterised protein [Mycobacteroides abscessus subsp. abscessus]|nr:Uncharacterised protein [Mycobacteroides abscessus subsp. abscessus]SHY62197.1 Uncharacterised protein [Mycobacteroides abscessus subsp. abscessus]SHY71649.1 Uncharacterised protein [Mycobacteroides abscessus subsp. abscessus]SIA16039.1 Uncharacterised protein [Mycobacteroides abscessus subsp. abscessus]SIB17065.1 Uncharacterised protein [Mycobacteroides abscessus subsp. abscessus]